MVFCSDINNKDIVSFHNHDLKRLYLKKDSLGRCHGDMLFRGDKCYEVLIQHPLPPLLI